MPISALSLMCAYISYVIVVSDLITSKAGNKRKQKHKEWNDNLSERGGLRKWPEGLD